MPVLTPRKPVTQKEPLLLVENQLPPGRYRFELVVTDDDNNESNPAQLIVVVRERPSQPTGPVIRPGILDRIDRGGPIPPEIIRPIRRPPS